VKLMLNARIGRAGMLLTQGERIRPNGQYRVIQPAST
jgi:hypothetical protein